jgi:ribosome-associated translation inhibitor RaiA
MAEQSLKTVYLKITAMIHPDREPDEAKKLDKTELLQKVNEAYAEQDLFYLLKLQLQLETNKSLSSKPLSSEQVKFYQLSLEAQSQNLQSQLEEIFASFHLSSHINIKQLKMSDVYKVIDKDVAELKQQLKWEKERLKHMKKVSGVEMLLGHGALLFSPSPLGRGSCIDFITMNLMKIPSPFRRGLGRGNNKNEIDPQLLEFAKTMRTMPPMQKI